MTTAEFRGFVRDELARQGKSMRDVAWVADVDHSVISRVVNGQQEPLLSSASRIAGALGYELEIVPEWVKRAQEKRLPAKEYR